MYRQSAHEAQELPGEETLGILNVPGIFQVPHTSGKIFSPELLTLSTTIFRLSLETDLKKMGEMTILDFPTIKDREKSKPVSQKNYPG